MSARTGGGPKLLFRGLGSFYSSVADLWYPMIRFVAGALFYHGWGKLMVGVAPVAAALAGRYSLDERFARS